MDIYAFVKDPTYDLPHEIHSERFLSIYIIRCKNSSTFIVMVCTYSSKESRITMRQV